jgi:hypothetical protein
MVVVARRYRRFPLLTLPASVLNMIGLQAPLLLIVALFGASVGGQFALATRVMAAPLALLSNAIGKPYFAEAARLAHQDPAGLRGLFLSTTRSLALISIVPIILAAVLSPILFGLVFGEEWSEAGWFAAILAPMYFLQLLTNPTHGTLTVLERQDLHLQRELGRMVIIGGAVVVAWALSLEARYAVFLVMLAGVATYTWYGWTSWRAIVAHDEARAERIRAEGATDEDAQLQESRP